MVEDIATLWFTSGHAAATAIRPRAGGVGSTHLTVYRRCLSQGSAPRAGLSRQKGEPGQHAAAARWPVEQHGQNEHGVPQVRDTRTVATPDR